MLRKIILEILTDRYFLLDQSSLTLLSDSLNRIHSFYMFSITEANASKALVDNVGAAIATFQQFFAKQQQYRCRASHVKY